MEKTTAPSCALYFSNPHEFFLSFKKKIQNTQKIIWRVTMAGPLATSITFMCMYHRVNTCDDQSSFMLTNFDRVISIEDRVEERCCRMNEKKNKKKFRLWTVHNCFMVKMCVAINMYFCTACSLILWTVYSNCIYTQQKYIPKMYLYGTLQLNLYEYTSVQPQKVFANSVKWFYEFAMRTCDINFISWKFTLNQPKKYFFSSLIKCFTFCINVQFTTQLFFFVICISVARKKRASEYNLINLVYVA